MYSLLEADPLCQDSCTYMCVCVYVFAEHTKSDPRSLNGMPGTVTLELSRSSRRNPFIRAVLSTWIVRIRECLRAGNVGPEISV